MFGVGASYTFGWCIRLLLVVSPLGLGGCWGGELARKDRDVRASWAALKAADGIAIAVADRLEATWRRSPQTRPTGNRFAVLNRMNKAYRFDLGDARQVARYGAARTQLLAHLKQTAETLASPTSAGLAWKLRGLRRACIAALLRSDGALRAYNVSAQAYNRTLGKFGHNLSKALLFPGRRQFALLADE